jgi:hypothetical protein
MGEGQIAFLIFASQSQREYAERDPIEGFVVHDGLSDLMGVGRAGRKKVNKTKLGVGICHRFGNRPESQVMAWSIGRDAASRVST